MARLVANHIKATVTQITTSGNQGLQYCCSQNNTNQDLIKTREHQDQDIWRSRPRLYKLKNNKSREKKNDQNLFKFKFKSIQRPLKVVLTPSSNPSTTTLLCRIASEFTTCSLGMNELHFVKSGGGCSCGGVWRPPSNPK